MSAVITYEVTKYRVKFKQAGVEPSGEPRYEEDKGELVSSYPESVQVPKVSTEEKKKLIIEVAQRLSGMNSHSFEQAKRENSSFYYKLILSKVS